MRASLIAVNLAATPQPSDANLLLAAFAAMTPAANAQADPSSSPFTSLIQLLTQSSNGTQASLATDAELTTEFPGATHDSSSTSAPARTTTSSASTFTAQAPDAIADSIIRAMLGGPAATPSLAVATNSNGAQPGSTQSFSEADPSSAGDATSDTPFTNSYSGDSPSLNDDAAVLAQRPLAIANPLLDSSSKNFGVPTSQASAVDPNAGQSTPIRDASAPDPESSVASADSADATVTSQEDIPAGAVAGMRPADPALPPNAIPSRKRKASDAAQAAALLTFAAPVATISSPDSAISKASAASSGAGSASTAVLSATTSSPTNSSAPTAPANNSQSMMIPVESNLLPGSAQSPNASRTAALAFGANIVGKVAAPNATADRTPAATPSIRSSQQDFGGDQAQNDSNEIPAPKAAAKQDSTGDSSQSDVGDNSSNSTQQPASTAAAAAPVSFAPPVVAPVTIAASVPAHAPAPTSNSTSTVSAALSAASPAPAVPSSAAPQQMTLRVSPPSGDAGTIDVRVAQRAGQMQVTVHTADPTLQANLRQDLPELVQSLDRAGFNAETFVQRGAAAGAAGSSLGASFSQGSAFGQSSFGQSSFNQGFNSGSSDSRAFGGGSGSANSQESPFAGQHFSGQQSSGHNARDREAERWLEQIEE